MSKPNDEVKSNLDKLANYFEKMDEKKQDKFLNWSSGFVDCVEMFMDGDSHGKEKESVQYTTK